MPAASASMMGREQIHGGEHRAHLDPMADHEESRRHAQCPRARFERLALGPVADEEQADLRSMRGGDRHRFDQGIETLARIEPRHRAHHEVLGAVAERGARRLAPRSGVA
jgi:hypothetical protein